MLVRQKYQKGEGRGEPTWCSHLMHKRYPSGDLNVEAQPVAQRWHPMPNDLRSDLFPDQVHTVPRCIHERLRETVILGDLWRDFGDPDFPISTAAVLHMLPFRRRE
jgi:hypothetical protein